jgi:hypothetical protein
MKPNATKQSETSREVSNSAWDRFWFTAISARPLGLLRIGSGLLLLLYYFRWLGEANAWFAAEGYLPAHDLPRLLAADATRVFAKPIIWCCTAIEVAWFLRGSLLMATLFTLGIATRITGGLAWFSFIAWLQMAPWLAGAFESWLAMLLLYLNLAPCGSYYSVDSLFRKTAPPASWWANVSLRLIQLHTLAFLFIAMLLYFTTTRATLQGDWLSLLSPYLAAVIGLSAFWPSFWLPAKD